MIYNYQSNANKPGIYKITNTHTGRIYYGQASSFKKRWYQHSNTLNGNKHQNKFLQNDFNKCKEELGHDNFLVFDVVEVMEQSTKKERSDKEQTYLDKNFENKELCYNLAKKAIVTDAPRKWKNGHTEEVKELIANSSRERWADPEFKASVVQKMKEACNTEEHRSKKKEIYESIKQKRESDPEALAEYKRKCSEHSKKLWEQGLIKDTEETKKNKSIAAKKRVLEGKSEHLKVNQFKNKWSFTIKSPDDLIHSFTDSKAKALELNLNPGSFRALCYGKIPALKGYRLVSREKL